MCSLFLCCSNHEDCWAHDKTFHMSPSKQPLERALLVNHQLSVESKTNDRRSSPPGVTQCGHRSKDMQFDKSPAKPKLDGGKRRSLLNRAHHISKASCYRCLFIRTREGPVYPRRAAWSCRPALVPARSRREGEMRPGPDGSSEPGPCRTAEALAKSQPNCHCWHGPPPLQAHNLCSHGC